MPRRLFLGFALGGGILKGILAEMPGSRYSAAVQGSAGAAWGNLLTDTVGQLGPSADEMSLGVRPVGEFASGGVVPGPYGSPQLAIVHGQEVIPGLNGEHMATAQAVYGSGGGVNNVFNFHGIGTHDEVEAIVIRAFGMSVRSPSAATTP